MNRFCLSLLGLMTFAGLAHARQNVVLPDLVPREVEITGNLRIIFPNLRRQPIVGFNPPPRVPDISPDRRPFTEAYKQPSADLPPSPLIAPEPPDVAAISRRLPLSGVIDVSAGRYLDRSISADVTLLATQKTTALLRGLYFGTDGHDVTVGGQSVHSGRNLFDGSLGLERRTGAVTIGISGGAFNRSYRLFGATPAPGVLSNKSPERSFSGYDGTLSLNSAPGSRVTLRTSVTAGRSHIDTQVFDPALRIDPSTDSDEGFIKVMGSLSIPVRDGSIDISGHGTSSGLDANSFPGSTVKSGLVQVALRYLYSSKMELQIGGAVLGFSSEPQGAMAQSRSLTYFAPVLRATYFLSASVQLDAGTSPSLDSSLMKDVMMLSPFLMDEPVLLPSLTSIDANVGIRVQTELFSASARAGWRDRPYFRYPVQSDVAVRGYLAGYSALGYSATDEYYATGDISVIFSPGIQAGVDFTTRNASVSSTNMDVPYLSPLIIGGFVVVGLMEGDLEMGLRVEHESSRTIDAGATNKVPAVTNVHLSGSYFFHENYGLTAGIRNLGSGPKFWDAYEFESNAFYLGARYRW